MNEEREVSVTLTAAYAAWAVSLALFGIAIATYALEGGRLAILIAEGSCIVSAMAATTHVKHFGERVCHTVRDARELTADIRRLQSR